MVCGSQHHAGRSSEALRAFCEMAEHFCLLASRRVGAPAARPGVVADLFAASDMLQILSLYPEGGQLLPPEVRRRAEGARAFVAARNRLLLETRDGLRLPAGRAGINVEAMRGAGALGFYPDAGLRYMKDLDVCVFGGADPAPLLEALKHEGWWHFPTPPGEAPMLTTEVPYDGAGAEAASVLFTDALRFEEGRPLMALYVEFNCCAADEAPGRTPLAATAAAAFRLAEEEFGSSEINLKHFCDAVLALDWMSAPCCAPCGDEGEAVQRVRRLLRPLGVIVEAEGCRFRRDLTDDVDVGHGRLVDFVARTAFGAGLT